MILTSRFSVSLALAGQGGSLTFSQADSAVMLDLAQFYAGPPGDVGPAGEGVPTGGTAGQVLAKASGDDFDTAWIDAGSASSVAWDDVTGRPTTFPPSGHAHAIADVTGLQAAMDGKATAAQGGLADSSVQPGDPVSDLAETASAKILTAAERTKLAGIEAGAQANVATDLSYTASTRVLASSTGADATLPLVSSTDAGLAPASGGGTTNFLRADGTWAAPAGGGGGGGGGFSFFMKPATGLYVAQASVGGALGSLAQTANRNTVAPFIPQMSFSIDQVGISVTVLATGASAKVVIYAADADGRPDAVLAESGDISCAATGTYLTALSFSFVAGQTYWIGVRSSSNPTLRTITAASQPVLSLSGAASPIVYTTLVKTETYADPAASWGYALAQHSNATVPLVLMRVA